jgi:hypothetical protein
VSFALGAALSRACFARKSKDLSATAISAVLQAEAEIYDVRVGASGMCCRNIVNRGRGLRVDT